MNIGLAVGITLSTFAMRPLIWVFSGMWPSRLRGARATTACFITILEGGAATHERTSELPSVETIGVVLPEESTDTLYAGEFVQLYNRTKFRPKSGALMFCLPWPFISLFIDVELSDPLYKIDLSSTLIMRMFTLMSICRV